MPPHGKKGVTSFTKVAVQAAMDRRAAKWAAPAGYYAVNRRLRTVNSLTQVWEVRVRLFAGSITHVQTVLFMKKDGLKGGRIEFGSVVRSEQLLLTGATK